MKQVRLVLVTAFCSIFLMNIVSAYSQDSNKETEKTREGALLRIVIEMGKGKYDYKDFMKITGGGIGMRIRGGYSIKKNTYLFLGIGGSTIGGEKTYANQNMSTPLIGNIRCL